jgi:hypothetical protein
VAENRKPEVISRKPYQFSVELNKFVMSRPIVSAGMIAKQLSITSRAAQNLVAELGMREATGRARYRAWGVF